jgi:transglutaminase-like putative cysteine protease
LRRASVAHRFNGIVFVQTPVIPAPPALVLRHLRWIIARSGGDDPRATALLEEAIARPLHDRPSIAWALYAFARVAEYDRRDLHAARALLDEALSLRQAVGNARDIAWSLAGLGRVAAAFLGMRLDLAYTSLIPQDY